MNSTPAPVSPLLLLVRVNARQGWRKLLGLRQQSRLLTAVIGLFIVGYLGLAFGLFYRGLQFIGTFPGLGAVLTERLLYLLFAFLFALLLFSNLVIGYTNFFRNRETSFLMSLPVTPQTIFRWKFLESALLASWAFLFLIAPLLAAYGLTHDARWHFYPLTLGLIALFIVLPAAFGAWLAVNLARYLDRRTFQVAAVVTAVVLLTAAAFWLRPEPVTDESLETRVLAVLDRLLLKTRFAQFPLLPSYWLSAGVVNWAEGALAAAGFFLLVLLSHALFFGWLACNGMGRLFYDAASMVQSRGSVFARWSWFQRGTVRSVTRAAGGGWVERILQRLPGVSADTRALIVKDVLIFWRDTTQWGQSLMLFGLLGAYVINLRHFTQQLTSPFWTHLIAYLNLGACALNLATLTTRFVYPQFSLEGKRLWIVGLAPLGLARVVLVKFWLASGASLVLTLGLMVLSCGMLRMPLEQTAYFSGAITVMTFTLTGLANGLGVLYPNFKEENPGKIVSGFGGTFCLVLSFLYILGSVVLLALGSPWEANGWQTFGLMIASWFGFALLSLALGWLPMRLALRRVTQIEV